MAQEVSPEARQEIEKLQALVKRIKAGGQTQYIEDGIPYTKDDIAAIEQVISNLSEPGAFEKMTSIDDPNVDHSVCIINEIDKLMKKPSE